jgi:hypothetical protein
MDAVSFVPDADITMVRVNGKMVAWIPQEDDPLKVSMVTRKRPRTHAFACHELPAEAMHRLLIWLVNVLLPSSELC